nr:amino acid permease [uncultured Rhodoferax sp.]
MSTQSVMREPRDADAQLLESMGYQQDLHRRMSKFSNFAVSFSIICILAGGITAFPSALGAGGGFSISLGWIVGAAFATVVALAMAQIASAYPTAGGLYHWGSILGNKGYGWVTAWFNLLGLVLVVASVNFGVYDPFFKTLIAPLLGLDTTNWGLAEQVGFISLFTITQALLNHKAAGLTTKLLDISGYLIFVIATVLTLSLWIYNTTPVDFSRLTTFVNFSGKEGSMWPESGNSVMVFLAGLLLTVYTITGFDASAHTSEETHNAAENVPKGIISSVLWSALFGFGMICTFVLVMPSVPDAVKQGMGFFSVLLDSLPPALKAVLGIGIFACNYLCALACLMSTSRMMYAFARDGGLPMSNVLKSVDPVNKTPGPAIWVSCVAAVLATLYADAFVVLSTACAVFLYISYVMPTAAGIFAEGKTWTRKGPFNLGGLSKPIGILAVLGGLVLIFVGIQPPNQKVLYLIIALVAFLAVFWWGFGERNRFKGPPAAK